MKILNELVDCCGLEFLEFLVLGHTVPSMAWFKTEGGIDHICKELQRFEEVNRPEQQTFEFDDDAIFDRKTNRRQTLKDRLGI